MRLSFLSTSIWAGIAAFLLSAGGSWAQQRFPVEDPSNLSAPYILPPVHDCALAVPVSGFRENALVTVFADGVPVGTKPDAKPDLDGSADIPLTRPLVLGETLTATQTVDSISSGHSHDPVPVTKRRSMHFHANYVSTSVFGDSDYYQATFEAEQDTDDPDSPYLLIQRQFEDPDDHRCYIETHDEKYCGHFLLRRVDFAPQKLSIELDRPRDNLVSVTFAMAATEFAEASEVVKIISGEIEPP